MAAISTQSNPIFAQTSIRSGLLTITPTAVPPVRHLSSNGFRKDRLQFCGKGHACAAAIDARLFRRLPAISGPTAWGAEQRAHATVQGTRPTTRMVDGSAAGRE